MGAIEAQQVPVLIPELLRLQFKGNTSDLEGLLNSRLGKSMKVKDLYDVCRIFGGAEKDLTWKLSS